MVVPLGNAGDDSEADTLALRLSSPEYVACAVYDEPEAGTAEVTVHVATPAVSERVSVPPPQWTGPEESLTAKVTAPVGVTALDGTPVTLAVNDAGEPVCATDSLLILVRESALDTDNVRVWLDALKLASPGYESVAV